MIVTFGETLLRLTPAGSHERLANTGQLRMGFAGAESNTGAALAQFGHAVYHVTAFPDHLLGDAAVNSLLQAGLRTEYILRSGSRVGAYYIESGASLRSSKVVYDRARSSFSEIDEGSFDWGKILEGQRWLHVSGITPALSEGCARAAVAAMRTAREVGVTVSFDLNFRRTLWKDAGMAEKIFHEMLGYTDYVFANEGSVADVFGEGVVLGGGNGKEGDGLRVVAARRAMAFLEGRYALRGIAFTLREHPSASFNRWSGIYRAGGEWFEAPVYELEIIERLGGGDQFASGMIHGILSGWAPAKSLGFAVAASALKHTIPGDMGFIKEKEALGVMEGNITGRVER